MKRLFIFTYPKLTLYFFSILLAYFIFSFDFISGLLNGLNYFFIFLAGLFYSAGFTTPLATGFFLNIENNIPFFGLILASVGALIADFGIFSFIRVSFGKEIHKLEKTSFISHVLGFFRNSFSDRMRKVLVYVFAFFIIASPLPDEIGVAMLAGFTKVHPYVFALVSFIANFVGIYFLVSL